MTATVSCSRCRALLGARQVITACRSLIDARATLAPGGFGASQWLIDNLGPMLTKTFTPGNAKKARNEAQHVTQPCRLVAAASLRRSSLAQSGI
jgi:hypothetical protein